MSFKVPMATPSDAGVLTIPAHVAIIMDGNGRWAKQKHLPRIEGHRQGAKSVRMVVEESRRLGVRFLTLYTFSSENWNRPASEIDALMEMLERYLSSELELMLKNQVRLRAIGDLERLAPEVRAALSHAVHSTQHLQGMDLTLALSYGGRDEIVYAARCLAAEAACGAVDPAHIDEAMFSQRLYEPALPDVDLLIRTSGECRISNFLLWQTAYAEIVISPLFWPDFSKQEYLRCLHEYSLRERRFGRTSEQIKSDMGGG